MQFMILCYDNQNFTTAPANLHALPNQRLVGLIRQQLHQPHRATHEHAVDAVRPLVFEVRPQSLCVERVLLGQRRADSADEIGFVAHRFTARPLAADS